eukprot:jgi/Chlat1/2589/Chrsp178S02493
MEAGWKQEAGCLAARRAESDQEAAAARQTLWPPEAWSRYFPGVPFNPSPVNHQTVLVLELLEFFKSPAGEPFLRRCQFGDTYALPLNMEELAHADGEDLVPNFYMALQFAPKMALDACGAATYEVIFSVNGFGHAFEPPIEPELIATRITHYEPSLKSMRSLKSEHLGQLVTLQGTAVRVGACSSLITHLMFKCLKCNAQIGVTFDDGKWCPPTKCTAGCRSKSFEPVKETVQCIDCQTIRLQEQSALRTGQDETMPRVVECELKGDLVDSCQPGDVVTVCGFIKTVSVDEGHGGKTKSSLYTIYIDAVSVVNANEDEPVYASPSGVEGSAPPEMRHFSAEDLQGIADLHDAYEGDLFRRIVHSLCPHICGHALVKAGIVLTIAGGVRKHVASDDYVPVRGDVHMLVVGDPGLGKSQLLKAAALASPRGVYVCGNATSSAGLTVTVQRDSATGMYAFEAGAMVLADCGLCCIDEFDKMTSEHHALLEAMEQQVFSVAKAGLKASVMTRTSVLAAANPVAGHYNPGRTIAENIKFSSPLLSRFDLIFILQDRPDDDFDKSMSEHVFALHKHTGAGGRSKRPLGYSHATPTPDDRAANSLSDRLSITTNDDFTLLTPQELRTFIAYARQFVFPKLTREAAELIQEFYLELRRRARTSDSMPVTIRQLESLIRLAEARAKLELCETITVQHAEESTLVKRSDTTSGAGFLSTDADRGGGKRTKGKAKEMKRFMAAMVKMCKAEKRTVLKLQELNELADDVGMDVFDITDTIDNLNQAGFLLKKSDRSYELWRPQVETFKWETWTALGSNQQKALVTANWQSLLLILSAKHKGHARQ